MKKALLIFFLSATVMLVGCKDQQPGNTPQTDAAPTRDFKPVAVQHAAPLLRALPENAIGYIRIPSLTGGMSSATGAALDPLVVSPELKQKWQEILQGFKDNLLPKIESEQGRELTELLLNHQASPLEIAALAAQDGSSVPNVFIQVKLALSDLDQVGKLLQQAVDISQGQLRFHEQFNEEGQATLFAGPMPVYTRFDLSSQTLSLLSGFSANKALLGTLTDGQAASRSDVYQFEQQFDAGGQGLSLWIDTAAVLQQNQALIPPHVQAILQTFKLDQSKFIWAGTGAKNGHASFRLHFQFNDDQFPGLSQASSADLGQFKTAGKVKSAVRMVLPTQTELEGLFAMADQMQQGDLLSSWQELLQNTPQPYKPLVDLSVSLLGSSMAGVRDRSGFWVGVKPGNLQQFKSSIQGIVEQLGGEYTQKTVQGVALNHLQIDWMGIAEQATADQQDDGSKDPEWLKQILRAFSTHVYWTEEDGVLVFAGIPQSLIARYRHRNQQSVSDWLNQQALPWDDTVLGFVQSSDKLMERLYYYSLISVRMFGDMAGIDSDISGLPLAEDLGIRENSRIGISLNTPKDAFSLVLNYEQSIGDFLFAGGSYETVAVVGILAAIALPAYQDYTERAKVSEVLLQTSEMKIGIAEAYLSTGEYPSHENAAFEVEIDTQYALIYYDDEENAIRILFHQGIGGLSGTEFALYPEVDEYQQINWQCVNFDVPENQLPASLGCTY